MSTLLKESPQGPHQIPSPTVGLRDHRKVCPHCTAVKLSGYDGEWWGTETSWQAHAPAHRAALVSASVPGNAPSRPTAARSPVVSRVTPSTILGKIS